MTAAEERAAINILREKYKFFPVGELRQPDSPDFIISDGSRRIGIETTQIVHSERAKQISSEQLHFTNLVLSKLVDLLPFHFSITIDLSLTKKISKSIKEQLAEEVANFCAIEFLTLRDMEHVDVEHVEIDLLSAEPYVRDHLLELGLRNLPGGINSISIFRCDAHGSSFNSGAEAAMIPNFTKEMLRNVLSGKESKIKTYAPCDEYWLVIWQGGGITGYFKNREFETPISSIFDKVFIVRSFENDFIILKP